MAHIKNRILNINVTADSDRQMMINFYEDISRKIPLFARKIHDYMKYDWMPEHPKSTNPICARTREQLSPSLDVQKRAYELPDGWVVTLNANYRGYEGHLARISDALGIVLDYKLHGNGRDQFERKDVLLSFWEGFVEHINAVYPNSASQEPGGRIWYDFKINQKGYHLSAHRVVQKGRIRFLVWVSGGEPVFDELLKGREQIEQITGPLSWDRKPGSKSCSIIAETSYMNDDLAYHWLTQQYALFKEAFGK